jgi:hypothetical protein
MKIPDAVAIVITAVALSSMLKRKWTATDDSSLCSIVRHVLHSRERGVFAAGVLAG